MKTSWITFHLWWIPFLPFLAAGVTALLRRERKVLSATLAIGAMLISFLLSLVALVTVHGGDHGHEIFREYVNFVWFPFGASSLKIGFLLDPLSAMMLLVVTFVSLLVFVFSWGYMDHDPNATRFFCFLSLFAGSMLALVIANSLLLLFMAWELVGLSSFLLIGFWYQKPSAVAAMKKAFITTRIGDVGFLIGLLWLYVQTGTTLFYDDGQGSLEMAKLAAIGTGGIALSISLLLFCGAVGKSGQFPLHVWLPDAMEGPTPVSALIHAATMVAAGVFLVGRMYPVFQANGVALDVVAYLGAFTCLAAATIALAQWDIKRILAFSTVSQLGLMMVGLGVGGYVSGLYHLFTHAFFKALLFLGSGSIIHACHHEQDIRKMGGLSEKMPLTFVCYGVGMLALSGVFPFSGFFSKDEIFVDALDFAEGGGWVRKIPFVFALLGAFLTAFYMTRQMKYVFFGKARGQSADHAHESSGWMVIPLVALAVMTVLTGLPLLSPWHNTVHHFLAPHLEAHKASYGAMVMGLITAVGSIFLGWKVYSGENLKAGATDPLERRFPRLFRILHNKYYVDEFYEATIIRFTRFCAKIADYFDRYVLNGIFVWGGAWIVYLLSLVNQVIDEVAINRGFDKGCATVRRGTSMNLWIQNGLTQHYLKIASAGVVFLLVLILWIGGR